MAITLSAPLARSLSNDNHDQKHLNENLSSPKTKSRLNYHYTSTTPAITLILIPPPPLLKMKRIEKRQLIAFLFSRAKVRYQNKAQMKLC